MTQYIKLIVGLAIVAALGAGGWFLYKAGGTQEHVTVVEAALAQTEKATAQTKEYQANVDQANTNIRKEEAANAERLSALAIAEQRMRNADRARLLARASAEALRDYAADLDRDFESCRDEYIALGGVAAAASTAAHGLADGWPGQSEWAEAQANFMKQSQDFLK